MDVALETALIIPVPAAEPVVGAHRARLDRAAAWGVPAHVTVLYPFLPLSSIRTAALARLFRGFPAFAARFDAIRWFDDRVVWVDPSPASRFRELTDAVWAAYPSHPPFRGEFADVVPHLTIGHDAPRQALAEAAASVTPFQEQITSVRLIAGLTGSRRWETVSTFSLGPP